MSTKNFILKIQSPTSATSSKDYILVVNPKLTITQFISDLQELYPPATEDKLLVLMLQGTYRMMPRQFLRHMWDNVDYKPDIQGGIYLPSLFGGGNVIKITYEEAGGIPITEPASAAPKLTGVAAQGPTATSLALLKVDEAIVLSSNLKTRQEKNTPQPQADKKIKALRPTHAGAPHDFLVTFRAGDENSSLKKYDLGYIRVQVPVSGGLKECIQLLPRIKSGMKKWLDQSTIDIVLCNASIGNQSSKRDFHIEWNEDSFSWRDDGTLVGRWSFTVIAYIYEKSNF